MKTTITHQASQLGISQSFLSMLFSGRRRPSWQTAKRLEAATGICAVDWIEGRVDREFLNNRFKEQEAA